MNYSQQDLVQYANQIKNEVEEGRNTAERVGSAFLRVIDYAAKSNDGQTRGKFVGFAASTNAGKVMKYNDGAVTFEEQGGSNNRCGTIPVTAGEVLYLGAYNIGSYEALSWAILNGNNEVMQSAGAMTPANTETPEYRIEVTQGGTLYVYMQYNVAIPTIQKVLSSNYEAERIDAAIKGGVTFSDTPEMLERQTAKYIANSTLESGFAVDALFSAGNTNNGVLVMPVTKGDIVRIEKANLGGYGNTYWTILNADGIVQHATGAVHTIAPDVVVVAQATGTLYVSFGYYDAGNDEYIEPKIYKCADLNARQRGVQYSIKSIYDNTLLTLNRTAAETSGAYFSIENGILQTAQAGNTNNGYLTLSLSQGEYVKVTGATTSAFTGFAWALCRANGEVIQSSGNVGYRAFVGDFDLIASEDAVLWLTFGWYDETAEEWTRPSIYTIANAGQQIEQHGSKIYAIDKSLFRQYVAFAGVDAPMVLRYLNGTLTRDTSVGNSLFKCFHVAVSKGDRYLVRGASVGGYDGIAWAVFAGNTAVQASSEESTYNAIFADEVIEIKQDGVLYVNNFSQIDDTLCELYRMDANELTGNPQTKPIVICGDSTSQGLASQFDASLLVRPRRVFKMGVGSENVYATAARMGAIPVLCMPVTIPATATAVDVSVTPRPLFKQTYNADGTPATPAVQNQYVVPMFVKTEHFYCTIAGIEGDLYTENDKTYFLRTTAGTAKQIKTPVEVVPQQVERVRNSLLVCLMGTNGGFLNYNADYVADNDLRGDQTPQQRAANLFDVMKRMFAYMGGEMVVIGFFCGELPTYYTQAFYERYERLCEQEFGERFINARLWLKDYAWQEMGRTLTATDKTYMQQGFPPVQLFDDNSAIHLSSATNVAFAKYVAERISHLGY